MPLKRNIKPIDELFNRVCRVNHLVKNIATVNDLGALYAKIWGSDFFNKISILQIRVKYLENARFVPYIILVKKKGKTMSSMEVATVSDLKKIDVNQLKAKSIGLNLLLFSTAEREVKRVAKMSRCIEALEDLIFDESVFDMLTPEEQMERYKLAIQTQQASLNYVKTTSDSINIDDLQSKIILLENSQSNQTDEHMDEKQMQDQARDLLTKFKPIK